MSSGNSAPAGWSAWLNALRPAQWTKNLVVFAAFPFALWDRHQDLSAWSGLARVLPAALLFCLASGSVYLFNDLLDRDADRRHPVKRKRPIASGRIAPRPAAAAAALLAAAALGGAALLSLPFARVLAVYLSLQAVYTCLLKRLALVDILVIAAGFVLRAIAGAVILEVSISPWLLLCTFLLALFLALCKRRHEKSLSNGDAAYRPSLRAYDVRLLDQLIAITSSTTLVSYAIYTLAPETVDKFGNARLGFTIPFVLFGVFRYLDLVYRHDRGDRPERILLTDGPLLANVLLYGVAVILLLAAG